MCLFLQNGILKYDIKMLQYTADKPNKLIYSIL